MVHQCDRHEGRANIDRTADNVLQKRVGLRESGRPPQNFSVIENDVDADKLLKRCQTDADPKNRTNSFNERIVEVAHARFVPRLQILLNLAYLLIWIGMA